MELAGKPTVTERWEFSDVDPARTRVTTTTLDEGGRPTGAPEAQTATWAELREHARFPAAATTVTDEPMTVPAGTFDCWRYVVTTPEGTRTLWFAKTLPGPPVKMVVVKGGATTLTMTMTSTRS